MLPTATKFEENIAMMHNEINNFKPENVNSLSKGLI